MKILTAAYSPLNELLPAQPYQVVSVFIVEDTSNDPPLVRGIWVARPDLGENRVEPIYMTQAQLEAMIILPDFNLTEL
jgi:hypothetical protein